jgi:hypothetical protein
VIGTPLLIWQSLVPVDFFHMPLPSIAWTGSDYRVAWFVPTGADGGASFTFEQSRVTTAAADPVTTAPFDASLTPVSSPVWNGTEYGVLATSSVAGGKELVFARVATTGALIGAPIPIALNASSPTLVWTGREYAAGWASATQEVQFARIGRCP